MDFILIALLTLLNAAFAMSEMALAASRKARLTVMAEAGDQGAVAAIALHDEPTQFLSTVQIGITSIGMLNGIVGEAAFSQDLTHFLAQWGMGNRSAGIVATTLVVVVITFFTLVFGELVPKRIGQLYPELVARWIARPMQALAKLGKPFVFVLTFCTQAVLKLLRVDTDRARAVTEEEISASLEEGVDAGLIEKHEHQMLRNVFHLDDRPLTSLMLPRTDIEWLDASLTVGQALETLTQRGRLESPSTHSWYPVCRGGLDDVVGVVGLGQILALRERAQESLQDHALAAQFIPETLTGMELLEQFRAKGRPLAQASEPSSDALPHARMLFVVDEYGVVQGLLTPLDLLEAITGELQPADRDDAWALPQTDGSWLLEGLMPVAELKARLGIESLPNEERGHYNTVAGLIMALSGHLPSVGEAVDGAGWRFTVQALEGRRIDKVLARALAQNLSAPAEPAR